MAPSASGSRSNPFGNAKYVISCKVYPTCDRLPCRPVDVSSREKEVADRLEKERESSKTTHPMSRSSSHTASDRNASNRIRTPPPAQALSSTPLAPSIASANVRPLVSFATAAAAKNEEKSAEDTKASDVTDKVTDVII
jgi:translation initiation factor 4B